MFISSKVNFLDFCFINGFPSTFSIYIFFNMSTIENSCLYIVICHLLVSCSTRTLDMILRQQRLSSVSAHNCSYPFPVHFVMFPIQEVMGLPLPLFPSTSASSNFFWIPSFLIKCPKYCNFLLMISFFSFLFSPTSCNTSMLVLCSVYEIFRHLLHIHISNASIFSIIIWLMAHVSDAYSKVDRI